MQLVGLASVASTFGGLMYGILILRLDIVAVVGAFVVGIVILLVIDVGIVHGGDMQVLHTYL